MIKKGSRVRIKSINKEEQGPGKLYPPKMEDMVGLVGTVTNRKNMFGVVPGLSKANLHVQYPNMLDFGDMLLDVCQFANPTLSFMDGIVAMEGEGPGSGDPVSMNVMLTSQSPHHLDVVASKIINLDPLKVPTILDCK